MKATHLIKTMQLHLRIFNHHVCKGDTGYETQSSLMLTAQSPPKTPQSIALCMVLRAKNPMRCHFRLMWEALEADLTCGVRTLRTNTTSFTKDGGQVFCMQNIRQQEELGEGDSGVVYLAHQKVRWSGG
ncbi:hypothetical protein BASA60_011457 [Batrachochytrium salamandrivorans]|nr:hypothetical protein BASA60_011457 [Batrachochytrium salamandrivorans]